MGVKTYDPKKVIITFGGVPITGFADGTFIQVTQDADSWAKKVGADGEVVRAKSNDNTHTVTITLQQSSGSKDYLSTCLNLDKLTNKGMLPLVITDLNGTTLESWLQAWVSKDPDWEYAKEATDRAWVLMTGQAATTLYGGVNGILGDILNP